LSSWREILRFEQIGIWPTIYAVSKLQYNDHGEVHAKVATASALTMLSLLKKREVPLDFIEAGGGDYEDEYLIVRELLSARTHAGLTQEEVAASMGTTKSAVSRLRVPASTRLR